MFDTVIVGGGPAGLNAALILGRVRRRVLLVDGGHPRNEVSHAVHGFLTRDGAAPVDLTRIGRDELSAYPSIEVIDDVVEWASASDDGIDIRLAGGRREHGRRLLLATGVADELPPIEGMRDLWGNGVYHCPYCHGWEVRDKPLAVLGQDTQAAQLAIYLTRLTDDVALCTNGGGTIEAPFGRILTTLGVQVRDERVSRVEGKPGRFERLIFDTGESLDRSGLFLRPPTRQRTDLAARLGCAFLDDGKVEVDEQARTTVPGVYAAGDLCRTPDQGLPAEKVIAAAAAGAQAAVAIDLDLLLSDLTSGRDPRGVAAPAMSGARPGAADSHTKADNYALGETR